MKATDMPLTSPLHSTLAVPQDGRWAGEPLPERASTWPEVLRWHASRHGWRTHAVFIDDGEPTMLDYLQLERRAFEVAHGLIARGHQRGQSVAIMLPTGPDYCACSWAF